MKEVKRVIFVAGTGNSRAPMAKAILEETPKKVSIEVLSRGLVVQFPEPMNQKAEAVMISNGIHVEGYHCEQLENEDITENTLILTMNAEQREKVIDHYENANEENTYVLSTYVGDEIEIIDPYGANVQTYGLCFEVLKKTILKLVKKLEG